MQCVLGFGVGWWSMLPPCPLAYACSVRVGGGGRGEGGYTCGGWHAGLLLPCMHALRQHCLGVLPRGPPLPLFMNPHPPARSSSPLLPPAPPVPPSTVLHLLAPPPNKKNNCLGSFRRRRGPQVYVLGRRTVVCRRPSLGDSHLGHEARKKGVLSLPRISCKSTYHKDSPEYKLSCGVVDANSASASYPDAPPDWLTHALAGSLRSALGLQLFNFDLICPEEQAGADSGQCLYYVVDINYFPGVDKIPNFEAMFVDFLTEACNGCGDAADAPDSSASDHSAALLPQQP